MLERDYEVIAIGASAGGVTAVRKLLAAIAPEQKAAIVVVQHIPPTARLDVGLIYHTRGGRPIYEAEDKMPVERGKVYMAAPGYHLLIEKDHSLALTQDEPVNHSRPSIDVFFESCARVYGTGAIGVVLTGANRDGAKGLSCLKANGGLAIVQDPADAEHDAMPLAAIQMAQPDFVLPLWKIGELLSKGATVGTEVRP